MVNSGQFLWDGNASADINMGLCPVCSLRQVARPRLESHIGCCLDAVETGAQADRTAEGSPDRSESGL